MTLVKKIELGISGPWLAGQEPHKIFTATSLAVLITLWHAVLDCSNQHGFNLRLKAQVRIWKLRILLSRHSENPSKLI